jgi:hypothetical protein
VIFDAGWLMYGSRKPDEQHAWKVTRCVDVLAPPDADRCLVDRPKHSFDAADQDLVDVFVILKGKQGAGKSILVLAMNLLFGARYCFESADPEEQLFSRFANGRKNKILVNIDESSALRYTNQLKNMLTSSTFNYEQKGVDAITLRNFNR